MAFGFREADQTAKGLANENNMQFVILPAPAALNPYT
jgi:hypothetical protein